MPERIKNLRNKTGCSLAMCKEAIEYADAHDGGEEMAIAYCKAKSFAVKTTCTFDERVRKFMEEV
ncbi:MAG: hypothetical protein IJZ68_05875 [Bacteroidaceae bacterium]|nr:hypothetical protein [Bacteroidaceae bacterium]